MSDCGYSHRSHRSFRLSVSSLAMLLLLSPSTGPAADKRSEVVRPDAGWDAVFTRTSGWTGGDVAGSIDLGDGRTLWVFGDSWIGDVADGKHAIGSRLVNNAVAIHRNDRERQGAAPAADSLHFHWGPNDAQGHSTAWIVPNLKQVGPDANAGKQDWYWPTGGGVVVPSLNEARKLVLFLYRVRRGDRPGTAWNFQVVGTTMAVVDRAGEPLENWRPRQVDLPITSADNRSSAGDKTGVTRWGMAARTDLEGTPGGQQHVYIYIFGTRSGVPLDTKLVVARADARQIERFGDWRFYAGKGRWSDHPVDAVPIADGLVTEFSVDRIQRDGRTCWLLVQSEPVFGRRILARTATRPEGPWSKPVAVHTVAEVEGKPLLFTYAAKGHGPLSEPGEIQVTFIVSSHKFPELVSDARLYRPRFVCVPIQLVPEAPQ